VAEIRPQYRPAAGQRHRGAAWYHTVRPAPDVHRCKPDFGSAGCYHRVRGGHIQV